MTTVPATTQALRWTGAIGIVTVAIVRCVVVFSGQVVFDVDPAIDPSPLAGLGPAGSLFRDAARLAACGCGLLGETLAGRKIDRLLVTLALLPAPVIAFHGLADAGDMWRGSTWLAAAVACVTLAHLGRDRVIRTFGPDGMANIALLYFGECLILDLVHQAEFLA